MKKETIVTGTIIIIVLGIILAITYFKNPDNSNIDEQTMQCIADNSLLILSKTCSHCANQKEILKLYLDYFNLIYVDEHPETWEDYNLIGVPTWIINNKSYPGVQTIDRLKQITGC